MPIPTTQTVRDFDNFIAPRCDEQIETLYQDDHILVINKPSGLLSLSGKHAQNKDSVHYRLVQTEPVCSLVHRLDFGTSGIMLVAKNKQINKLLSRQFSERQVSKVYQALLFGHLPQDSGVIDAAIYKDPAHFPKLVVNNALGKPAISHFHCLARGFIDGIKVSQVEYRPSTGRTHQLRVHSQYIGAPILGCDLYGCKQSERLAKRLMLHACQLAFSHPVSGKPMTIGCLAPFAISTNNA